MQVVTTKLVWGSQEAPLVDTWHPPHPRKIPLSGQWNVSYARCAALQQLVAASSPHFSGFVYQGVVQRFGKSLTGTSIQPFSFFCGPLKRLAMTSCRLGRNVSRLQAAVVSTTKGTKRETTLSSNNCPAAAACGPILCEYFVINRDPGVRLVIMWNALPISRWKSKNKRQMSAKSARGDCTDPNAR